MSRTCDLTVAYGCVHSPGSYSSRDAVIAISLAFTYSMQIFQTMQTAIYDLSCRLDAIQTYVAEAIG